MWVVAEFFIFNENNANKNYKPCTVWKVQKQRTVQWYFIKYVDHSIPKYVNISMDITISLFKKFFFAILKQK